MQYKSTGNLEYVIIGHEITNKQTDDEGNVTYTYGDAFLVNARGDIPESWLGAELEDEPTTPRHVFANGDHKYFRWDNEAEFRAVEPEQESEDD